MSNDFTPTPVAEGGGIVGSVCWRPRRRRPREAADALLLASVGLAIVGISLALSAIDVRYALPLVPLFPPAAVLALHRRPGSR